MHYTDLQICQLSFRVRQFFEKLPPHPDLLIYPKTFKSDCAAISRVNPVLAPLQ